MATTVDSFDWPIRSTNGNNDKYFDGQVWQLTASDAGRGGLPSLRSTLITASKRKGLRLYTTIRGDTLIVQAVPKDDSSK